MKNKSKRILIYKARNLLGSSGGIERIVSWLANGLADKGYEVYIATRDSNKGDFFFPLSNNINFKHFDPKFSKIKRLIGKIFGKRFAFCDRELHYSKMLRQYCDEIKPDIIIATGVKDLQDIVYYNPYPCHKVLQLHSAPEYLFANTSNDLKDVVGKADTVQVLLKSFVKDIKPLAKGNVVVIGNPIDENDLIAKREKIIIYAARVEPSKQHHVLIEAFTQIAKHYPEWQVHFYGGIGNKKYFDKCLETIENNNLQDIIIFKGVTKELTKKYAEASICGFVSAQEGFGMALAESMAAGLPCIGFKYAVGVNELIKHDKNGYLAKDTNDFAKYLRKLIDDEKLREKFGAQGKKDIEVYNPALILSQWEDIVAGV